MVKACSVGILLKKKKEKATMKTGTRSGGALSDIALSVYSESRGVVETDPSANVPVTVIALGGKRPSRC